MEVFLQNRPWLTIPISPLPSGSFLQVPGMGPEFLTSAADSLVLPLPLKGE